MNERDCNDCGYFKDHLHFSYCSCYERKDIPINKEYNCDEAKTCEFYDDDSWMK